ncbi:MAG: transglycosylase domain-containing protein [Cyclobacteriaceae bacterium]|nr:transglycosylase domain-containing protein [Cyclobacteriaceae bacterium]MCB0499168.1 transglycosylase domain-containing protein [Cyclobacteriaceae bacterium]MCB9237992.1 transglycosylase domain-containing protein [Flammeovirgaceae bacterium]MCO5272900.1 transglycosylase domain-containing protein [Cyclobacteriaceae bacterium]MCW5901684.1 transglycosylase domain-containing protein [Cyclobacteriaceae bacterium]
MSTSPSLIETIKSKTNKLLGYKSKWFGTITKWVWVLLLAVLLGLPIYVFTVSINLFGLYGAMPSIKEVENPENDLSSEIISADGVSLGRYFRYNRSQVLYEELSEDLINTLVISEDHRFYNHSGLDFPAYIRVLFGLLTFNHQGGGSTITQQLAKNLYTMNPEHSLDGKLSKLGSLPRRIIQKTKEWIISVNLEKNFTKHEIIAMYLNTVTFSSNSFGIKVAAETYFNKQPDSLNLQESAVLVGMLQAATYYNPQRNPENSLRKRNEVLYKVYKHGYKIKTREQYDSITALPIELNYKVQNQNEGLATYFRTVMSNYLMQFCDERGIDLWNSGLRIYTTIDSKLQKYAEEAMAEHMKPLQLQFNEEWKKQGRNPWVDDNGKEIPGFLNSRIKRTSAYKSLVEKYGENSDSLKIALHLKRPMTVYTAKGERDTLFSFMDSLNHYMRYLQAGLMAMDPATGHIKAWVGGVDHKYFKYDHVKQGTRQPGSTFKPFVYGLAMESGYSPCHPMKDIAPSFKVPGGVWWPPNSDGTRGSGEEMTLRQAMARSVNSITAQMMQALGAENVVEFAHRVGITSKLDPVPSLSLGTSDVSLFELVGAYSTFANGGIFTEPFFITRIEDKHGNVIENFVPKTRQAINEQTAYKMIYMLMGGVEEEGGSSVSISPELKIDNEVGGKTGTTNNASDGWYVGLTHDLVTGVWVGGDERSIHFPSWLFGQGARTARPIWDKFMMKAYADPESGITKGQFKRPSTGLDISLDCLKVGQQPDSVEVKVQPWDING